MAIAVGVMLGYPVQFYVAIQIMFSSIRSSVKTADRHPFVSELVFRSVMVLVTFSVAVLVPNLGLLLSLIGAACSTGLVMIFPPLMELMLMFSGENGISWFVVIKDSIILLISLFGFLTGGYESLSRIIETYFD
jgi:solute carrier family 36 (proton-coupled amino acid transporter)